MSIIKLLTTDFSPIKRAVKGEFLSCYLPRTGLGRGIDPRESVVLNPFGRQCRGSRADTSAAAVAAADAFNQELALSLDDADVGQPPAGFEVRAYYEVLR